MTAYVVTYTGYAEDVKVLRCSDLAMAKKVAAAQPSNRTAFAVATATDISVIALTGATVLKLYNALAERPVTKFENRTIGHERLIRLLEEKFGNVELTVSDEPDDGNPPPTETQHDAEPGEAQTDAGPTMEEGADDMAAKKKAAKAAKTKAPKTGRTRKNADAKITLLVKENPKRKGTAAHARYAKYETGMTVGEALKKGITSADLVYDAKHNYIRIAD